jgi:hypothetical protein
MSQQRCRRVVSRLAGQHGESLLRSCHRVRPFHRKIFVVVVVFFLKKKKKKKKYHNAKQVHAMGFNLPHHVPKSATELLELLTDPNRYRYQYPIFESMPSSLSHLHVDWILYKAPDSATIRPKLVVVADVKDSEFSSDHFPIVGLFNITLNQ